MANTATPGIISMNKVLSGGDFFRRNFTKGLTPFAPPLACPVEELCSVEKI
jgi:hypothetical protein